MGLFIQIAVRVKFMQGLKRSESFPGSRWSRRSVNRSVIMFLTFYIIYHQHTAAAKTSLQTKQGTTEHGQAKPALFFGFYFLNPERTVQPCPRNEDALPERWTRSKLQSDLQEDGGRGAGRESCLFRERGLISLSRRFGRTGKRTVSLYRGIKRSREFDRAGGAVCSSGANYQK